MIDILSMLIDCFIYIETLLIKTSSVFVFYFLNKIEKNMNEGLMIDFEQYENEAKHVFQKTNCLGNQIIY